MEKTIFELPAPAIDGSWRVDSYGAKLTPARNRTGFEDLRLIDYRSMVVYGSFTDNSVRELVRHGISWALRQSDSILTTVSSPLAELVQLDSLPLLKGSTEEVLDDLIRYGKGYAELLQSAHRTWSSNGKYLTAFLSLSAEDLSDSVIREQLSSVLELASRTVLRPFILIENPRRVPGEIQDRFDWQAFVGVDQIAYFRDRYARDPEPGMVSRITVGTAMDGVLNEAREINGLGYDPTEESLDRKRAIADEITNYEHFLEGLTDGS